MRICLFGRAMSRYKTSVRTKVFVCGFMGLFLYCVVVIELGPPGERFSLRRKWNQFRQSVSFLRVYRESCRPSGGQSFTADDVIRNRVNDVLFCANLSTGILPGKAAIFLQDPFAWQRVSGRVHETYVFSAYYDNRRNPAVVVIVGISDMFEARKTASSKPSRGKEMCRIWFPGEATSDVVTAEFNFIRENHGHRYAASLHFCPLKRKDSVPYAVSLIVDRCRQSTNIVRVQNDSDEKRPKVNYTVCVSPLINAYNNYQQLIESVELNRIFGAQEFLFYNLSTDSVIVPFLNSYVEEGLARVIPWNIPLVDIHYFGQVAALNDCLYRSLFRSRFLVFTDLDEFIVPRRHTSWDEMLDAAVDKPRGGTDEEFNFPATFIFRSTLFLSRYLNDSRTTTDLIRFLGLKTLMHTVRESRIFPFNSRTKYIARPAMFQMVGIHFPFKVFPRFTARTIYMDTNLGLVHHYRSKRLQQNNTIDEPVVVDGTLSRFQDLIVSKTKDAYRRVGEMGNWSVAKLPVDRGPSEV